LRAPNPPLANPRPAAISTKPYEAKYMSDTDNNNALTPRKHGFQPGNPGRPKGSQNKRTQFLTAIGQANAEEIISKTVECAKQGKPWAIQLVLERLYPPMRSRLVQFPLPPLNSLADIQDAIVAVLQGVAAGQLTIEEGDQLANILERHGKAINDAEIEARLKRLEEVEARRLS
jgi:hypothetical protein